MMRQSVAATTATAATAFVGVPPRGGSDRRPTRASYARGNTRTHARTLASGSSVSVALWPACLPLARICRSHRASLATTHPHQPTNVSEKREDFRFCVFASSPFVVLLLVTPLDSPFASRDAPPPSRNSNKHPPSPPPSDAPPRHPTPRHATPYPHNRKPRRSVIAAFYRPVARTHRRPLLVFLLISRPLFPTRWPTLSVFPSSVRCLK